MKDLIDEKNRQEKMKRSINKISQNEIHAGQYLTIPYYSSIAIAGK